MIRLEELDRLLVEALPELAVDRAEYERRRNTDPEFTQTFFGYSFVPTLQAAIDQNVMPFCQRAFALIEKLVVEGDEGVAGVLEGEFFEYGPACQKWMRKGEGFMGQKTRQRAQRRSVGSSS